MDERDKYFLMRRNKRIKMEDVAAYIGVSKPMISQYERQKKNLSPDKELKYKEYIENY